MQNRRIDFEYCLLIPINSGAPTLNLGCIELLRRDIVGGTKPLCPEKLVKQKKQGIQNLSSNQDSKKKN
jgi:hypothetical protein